MELEEEKKLNLEWKIKNWQTDEHVASGSFTINSKEAQWRTCLDEFIPWDIENPQLYKAIVSLKENSITLDTYTLRFGIRRWECKGTKLILNGQPVFVRANCWSHHYPEHCSLPYDKEYWQWFLSKLIELGFNMAKFLYSNVPMVCLETADELGIPIQASVAYIPSDLTNDEYLNTAKNEMAAYVKSTRNIAAFAMLRLSGEYFCYDKFIYALKEISATVKAYNSDLMIIPSHAVAGLNYQLNLLDDSTISEPGFLYNARIKRELDKCTDIYGYYSLGILSYNCPGDSTWRDADLHAAIYEKPLLAHELGMKASYIDLKNEKRYTGRIPPRYYIEAREQLEAAGILDKAEQYYEKSAIQQQLVQKYCIEETRLCRLHSGYEYLGAFDQFASTFSYTAGFLNEFGELKPANSVDQILKYQSDNVLLLDFEDRKVRTYFSGDRFNAVWTISLYGKNCIEKSQLKWYILCNSEILLRGTEDIGYIENGRVSALTNFNIKWPQIDIPCKVTLYGCLESKEGLIENQWEFWIFPHTTPVEIVAFCDNELLPKLASRYIGLDCSDHHLRIVHRLDECDIEHLEAGKDVILFGTEPFPSHPIGNPLAIGHASSLIANLGTLIFKHPATDRIPNEGYGAWQIHTIIHPENTQAVYFNHMEKPRGVTFDPIIEVISSDKQVRKQAIMFEYRIGGGRLFVFTGIVDVNLPANSAIIDSIFEYVTSSAFLPKHNMSIELLRKLIALNHAEVTDERTEYLLPVINTTGEFSYKTELLHLPLWESAPLTHPYKSSVVGDKSEAEVDYNAGAGTGEIQSRTVKQDFLNMPSSYAQFVRDDQYIYLNATIEDDWFSDADGKSYYSRPGGFGDDVLYVTLKSINTCITYQLSQNAEGAYLAGNIEKMNERPFAVIDKHTGFINYRLMLPLPIKHDHIPGKFNILLKIRHKQRDTTKPLILEYNLSMK